jgi:hypothetical protein
MKLLVSGIGFGQAVIRVWTAMLTETQLLTLLSDNERKRYSLKTAIRLLSLSLTRIASW